jgi:hypothetical protein
MKSKGRYDLQVVYPDGFVYSITSRKDVTQTPEMIAKACEEFAADIRAALARREAAEEKP